MRITALDPCPPAGTGVHSWLMGSANVCRNLGLTPSETHTLLAAESAECGRDVSSREISDTIEKSFREAGWTPADGADAPAKDPGPKSVIRRGTRPKDVNFSPAKLANIARRIPPITEDWFRARSPIDVSTITPATFLGHLYKPGEKIGIYGRFDAKEPDTTVTMEPVQVDPACLQKWERGHQAGVWFLPNPVDGEWHDTDYGGRSVRNWRSVTSFRFVVLESDQADTHQWLSALAQFPVPIAAVYTSGGRSIHALWQLNAGDKEQWDRAIARHKPPLKIIGADPGSLSAVRLSRLPQCERKEKGAMQELLFLNPNPQPLARLPVLR